MHTLSLCKQTEELNFSFHFHSFSFTHHMLRLRFLNICFRLLSGMLNFSMCCSPPSPFSAPLRRARVDEREFSPSFDTSGPFPDWISIVQETRYPASPTRAERTTTEDWTEEEQRKRDTVRERRKERERGGGRKKCVAQLWCLRGRTRRTNRGRLEGGEKKKRKKKRSLWTHATNFLPVNTIVTCTSERQS